MEKESQNRMILKHLQSGRSITQASAIALFNCYRLSARINNLRNMGHDIKTNMIYNNGKGHASYVMEM